MRRIPREWVQVTLLMIFITLVPSTIPPDCSPRVISPPVVASTTLVDGIYEILDPADVKSWRFGFQRGVIIKITIGYFSIGEAFLQLDVVCPTIQFALFSKEFSQSSVVGKTEAYEFAAPANEKYELSLTLLNPRDYAIVVYIKIETRGQISNPYMATAGPDGTPLCEACVFNSDFGGTERYFYVNLNHDTIYWFSVAPLTPFDSRYEEQNQVQVSGYIESLSTGARLALAVEGALDSNVLTWRSAWFGVSEGDWYQLNINITASRAFRLGVGFSIAQYRTSGNSQSESPEGGADENKDASQFELSERLIVLGAVFGGIIAVIGAIAKFSKRSSKVQAEIMERSA